MEKKIILGIIAVATVLIAASLAFAGISSDDPRPVDEKDTDIEISADVIMPTKVSRPGCEKIDNCYVPSQFSITSGESVSWLNDDSAFHSVTSGEYGSATGLFDSGYMDPGDVFTHVFVESGEFVYHCTLHEWMRGIVLVN